MSQAPPPSSQPGPREGDGPQPQHRCWSHPLLVAVVAAVIGGIFSVLGVLLGQSQGVLGTPGPATPQSATPPTSTPTAGKPSSPSPSPSVAAHSVLYGPGEIRLGRADLDTVPPDATAGMDYMDIGAESVTGSSASMYSVPFGVRPIVGWEGAGPPTPEGCDDRLTRLPERSVTVGVGDTVCVRSDGGEVVAAATVAALEPDDGTVLVSVIVWSD